MCIINGPDVLSIGACSQGRVYLCGDYCPLTLDSAQQARDIFDVILQSKFRADKTRNALTVLQRYRFLFGLPKNIEKNIRNVSFGPVCVSRQVCPCVSVCEGGRKTKNKESTVEYSSHTTIIPFSRLFPFGVV